MPITHPTTSGAPSRALFVLVGEALWGANWQTEMANALGISARTVRYWVSGARPVQPYAQGQPTALMLAALVDTRIEELRNILKQLPS